VRPFVDTNVLVYANDPADSGKQRIARETLRAHAEDLVLSAQVLSELFVVLTRPLGLAMGIEDARAIVQELRRFPVVPVDDPLVLDAIEVSTQAQISYWDGLIIAAARAGGCDSVLTEDLSHDAVIAGVRIENPFAT
jgi:predicted nucleic acid-binding protein